MSPDPEWERTPPEQQDLGGPGMRVRITLELDQRDLASVAAITTRVRKVVPLEVFRENVARDRAGATALAVLAAVAMAPQEIVR